MSFAIKLERLPVLSHMLTFAKALDPIADAGDRWNSDPWLLGTPGGVVDLRTGAMRPGTPDDRTTMQTSAPYDANADCPRWEQFVPEVFAQYPELVTFIHRAIGYSLTGITTEQVLFLLYGTGANGKGTLGTR